MKSERVPPEAAVYWLCALGAMLLGFPGWVTILLTALAVLTAVLMTDDPVDPLTAHE